LQLQHQKITLDVNDTRAFTVLNAHQGDSKTRFIDITLTESGNTITLSSNYVATVKASINNKTKAVNTAVVNTTNNIITVELTKTMLDTPGLLNCEVILQDNQQFVTSATFTVKVAESVISDETEIVASQEFGKLLDALIEIKDIEDKADRVQTLVDNIDKLESADEIVTRLSNVESKETQLETQHRTDVQGLNDKTNNIVEQANTDRQNFNNSVDEINTTLDTKENVSNKVSEITHPSLDYYPDTKAVCDYVNSKLETPLAAIDKCVTDLGKVANISDNLYQFNDYGLYAESGADPDNATEYYWHSMPIPVKIGDVLRTSKHASWLAAFITMYDSNNNLVSLAKGSLTNYYTNRDNDAYDEITIKTFTYNGITYIGKDFEGYIIISFSQGDLVKDPTKNVIVKNIAFPDNYAEYGKVTLNESIPLTAQQKKELLPIENKVMGVKSTFTKPFVCINFDDFSFDDDRFKIVHDEYGFPATVSIIPNFNTTQKDYTNYIKLLESNWDVGLYQSAEWPPDTYGDEAYSDSPTQEVVSAWESYVSKTVEKAKMYGIYLPITWLCRQMRTCVALEEACKKHGIKYIRGDDMNNWTTSLYFKPSFKMAVKPSQLYPDTVDTVLENINTAVENGYGCTVFSHRLYGDENTAKKNYGCTVANLRKVLDKIKDLYDSGKIEVITFSDMYRKYFPDEMDNIEKRRNVLVALESKVN